MISWFRLSHRASLAAVAFFALGGCLAEATGNDGEVDGTAALEEALSAPACVVTYDVVSEGTSSFKAKITIQNTDSKPYNGWRLGFTFPNGQRVSTVTGAKSSQKGSAVDVTNVRANGVVPVDATVSFDMTASRGSTNGVPAEFSVNGAACARGVVNGGGGTGGSRAGSGSSGVGGP